MMMMMMCKTMWYGRVDWWQMRRVSLLIRRLVWADEEPPPMRMQWWVSKSHPESTFWLFLNIWILSCIFCYPDAHHPTGGDDYSVLPLIIYPLPLTHLKWETDTMKSSHLSSEESFLRWFRAKRNYSFSMHHSTILELQLEMCYIQGKVMKKRKDRKKRWESTSDSRKVMMFHRFLGIHPDGQIVIDGRKGFRGGC